MKHLPPTVEPCDGVPRRALRQSPAAMSAICLMFQSADPVTGPIQKPRASSAPDPAEPAESSRLSCKAEPPALGPAMRKKHRNTTAPTHLRFPKQTPHRFPTRPLSTDQELQSEPASSPAPTSALLSRISGAQTQTQKRPSQLKSTQNRSRATAQQRPVDQTHRQKSPQEPCNQPQSWAKHSKSLDLFSISLGHLTHEPEILFPTLTDPLADLYRAQRFHNTLSNFTRSPQGNRNPIRLHSLPIVDETRDDLLIQASAVPLRPLLQPSMHFLWQPTDRQRLHACKVTSFHHHFNFILAP